MARSSTPQIQQLMAAEGLKIANSQWFDKMKAQSTGALNEDLYNHFRQMAEAACLKYEIALNPKESTRGENTSIQNLSKIWEKAQMEAMNRETKVSPSAIKESIKKGVEQWVESHRALLQAANAGLYDSLQAGKVDAYTWCQTADLQQALRGLSSSVADITQAGTYILPPINIAGRGSETAREERVRTLQAILAKNISGGLKIYMPISDGGPQPNWKVAILNVNNSKLNSAQLWDPDTASSKSTPVYKHLSADLTQVREQKEVDLSMVAGNLFEGQPNSKAFNGDLVLRKCLENLDVKQSRPLLERMKTAVNPSPIAIRSLLLAQIIENNPNLRTQEYTRTLLRQMEEKENIRPGAVPRTIAKPAAPKTPPPSSNALALYEKYMAELEPKIYNHFIANLSSLKTTSEVQQFVDKLLQEPNFAESSAPQPERAFSKQEQGLIEAYFDEISAFRDIMDKAIVQRGASLDSKDKMRDFIKKEITETASQDQTSTNTLGLSTFPIVDESEEEVKMTAPSRQTDYRQKEKAFSSQAVGSTTIPVSKPAPAVTKTSSEAISKVYDETMENLIALMRTQVMDNLDRILMPASLHRFTDSMFLSGGLPDDSILEEQELPEEAFEDDDEENTFRMFTDNDEKMQEFETYAGRVKDYLDAALFERIAEGTAPSTGSGVMDFVVSTISHAADVKKENVSELLTEEEEEKIYRSFGQ